MSTSLKKDSIVFFFIFVFTSICALVWHHNINIDLYSYQLYNGWAFINNRLNTDLLVANFRTYWNPYLDAIQYFMAVKLNNHRFIYALLMNLDNVAAIFLNYKIIDKILIKNIKYRNLSVFLTVFYTIFSPNMYYVLNCSRNDMFLAVLILFVFYVFLTILDNDNNILQKTCIAGFVTGLIVALKLTSIVYGLTFLICFAAFYKNFSNPVKVIGTFLITSVLTFFVVDGYWLYVIYSKFQNPVFPMFNNYFRSPYAATFNSIYSVDYQYLKSGNLYHFLFYPFLKFNNHYYGFEDGFSFDYRYGINLICLIAFSVILFTGKFKNKVCADNNYVYLLILFSFFSFEIDVILFGTYRYITATSLLFGLNVFLFLSFVNSDRIKLNNCIMILLTIIVMFTQRFAFSKKWQLFFDQKTVLIPVERFDIEDNSVCLVLGYGISGYMVNQNSSAKYISFIYPVIGKKIRTAPFSYCSVYVEKLLAKLLNSNKKVYIFIDNYLKDFRDLTLESISYYSNGTRKLDNCKTFGDKENPVMFFCELVKK